MEKRHSSHGTGAFSPTDFRSLGEDCVFESGVLVFHPENISLGRNVYVGHNTILKGYHRNEMRIGDETW
ncbi:MAG TPA: transferase, partial [Polyangia bacterium]